MSRRTRLRLATVAVSTIVALGAAELGLRLLGYNPLGANPRAGFLRASADPDLEYELVPGAHGHAWETDVEINSAGFRDREYSPRKPPGVMRVAALGDSITFGVRLRPEDTWPEVLEAGFVANGRPLEVLNLGVGGYDTLQEVAFLERVGLAFDPDLVVVGLCINDVGIASVNLRIVRALESYGWLLRRVRLLQLVAVRLDRSLALRDGRPLNEEREFRRRSAGKVASLGGDAEQLERIRSLRSADDDLPYVSWYGSEDRVGWLRHALERLRRLSDRQGFPVVVLIIPHLDEGGHPATYARIYECLAHEAERAGFGVVQPRHALTTEELSDLATVGDGWVDTLHPNAAGHRMLARELADALGWQALPARGTTR